MVRNALPLALALLLVACSGGSGADRPDATADRLGESRTQLDDGGADLHAPEGGAKDTLPLSDLVDLLPDPGPDTETAEEILLPDEESWDALPDVAADLTDLVADVAADLSAEDLAVDLAPEASEEIVVAPPPLFDHEMIRDAGTAQCTFSDHHTVLKDGVLVDAWHVTYLSWESIDGTLQPIVIQGFAARPAGGSGKLPGIVQAHGLGGFAKEQHATGTAALLGMFVLAYTGPGGGDAADNTSEGLPSGDDDGYRIWDTLTDLRGSWFWGHAVAGMRGLTCLENREDVDGNRLGMTGFSAGGVVTTIAAGVDDRVKAAVPLSGTLAWAVSTQSPKAWQHELLKTAGLTIDSPEWAAMQPLIDPGAILPGTQAKVFMVNGTSDEFFPMTAHMATYGPIAGASSRLSFVGNFDHGCYLVSGGESANKIEERADLRAKGAQRAWFRHHFATDDDYAYIPAAPTFSPTPAGLATLVTAAVDPGGPHLEVEKVHVWASNDDAFLFGSVELKPQGGGIYGELALFPMQANTVMFVDVEYKTKDWLFPEHFSVSSEPTIPAGFIPHIRDINSCL